MANESVATRLTGLSGSLEGVRAILETFLESTDDIQVQAISYTLVDHLRYIGKDLDGIAAEIRGEG